MRGMSRNIKWCDHSCQKQYNAIRECPMLKIGRRKDDLTSTHLTSVICVSYCLYLVLVLL